MNGIENLLSGIAVPPLLPIRQKFSFKGVTDVAEATRSAIEKSQQLSEICPGSKIAIGVGSRGIANLPIIVRTVVEIIKEGGATPFIIPAMGSHGGATAQGQQNVLAHLGITEDSVGAPIRSTMEVCQVGVSANGLPLWVDKYASEADGIVVINRIKPHTSFHGTVESGLLKMLVIGLGKQRGADSAHVRGFAPMAEHILDMSSGLIARLPICFGLAILENAYDETAQITALAPIDLLNVEPKLLDQARSLMPKILLNDLHVLIVDEIGKDISGVGMDPNVTGRFPNDLVKGELRANRVVVLRLTAKTDGNAAGIGMADATTTMVEDKIDRVKGYMNSLTSTSMTSPKLPMVLASDRLAIQAAIKTCFEPDVQKLRIVRIKNTLSLEHIWVSEALMRDVQEHESLEILGQPTPWRFDEAGNCLDVHS